MAEVSFIPDVHAHQPVGSFPEDHQRPFSSSPDDLSEFPRIPIGFHLSGVPVDGPEPGLDPRLCLDVETREAASA